MNARLVALTVLKRVEEDGAYSNLALAAELARFSDAPEVDRRLTTELVLGVLRSHRLLDAWIDHLTARPQKLDAGVRRILRLSLYQLISLDRIPAHAVLNEAGELCRRLKRPHAVGLVNAVLRRCLRECEDSPLPPLPEDPFLCLAVTASIPDWLMARWMSEERGAEAAELLNRLTERARRINSPAPLTLAVNPLRHNPEVLGAALRAEGVSCAPGAYFPGALVLGSGGFEAMSRLVKAGDAHVMDEAAQLVTQLLDPQPGDRVLDLCAAPGGKSLWMAGRVGTSGEVVSVDISEAKLGLLRQQAAAAGFTWVKPLVADATRPVAALAGQTFDRVLVDAPCSALGVIRRHPEIRWRRESQDIPQLAQTARSIADVAMRHVAPGGVLVFSVCTTTAEEGPDQLAFLLEAHGWTVETHPSIPAELWRKYKEYPYLDTSLTEETDGFVAFRLRRPTG